MIFTLALLALPGQAAGADDSGAMPVSIILNNAVDVHEQDIRQKIFEYEFEAAKGSPAVQSDLVRKRCGELIGDAATKKKALRAILLKNGSLSYEQMRSIAQEMNGSIDRLDGLTKKLEEHAAGLSLLDGHHAFKDPIMPLMSDIDDARGMAARLAQAADFKKTMSPKNTGKPH